MMYKKPSYLHEAISSLYYTQVFNSLKLRQCRNKSPIKWGSVEKSILHIAGQDTLVLVFWLSLHLLSGG